MELHLSGKVVYVTGASGGIGRAIASLLAEEGASLVLQGFGRAAEMERWVAEQPWEARALCGAADVRDPAAQARLVRAGEERFGRVDGAVACAGVWPRAAERLHEASIERLRGTIETNLLGSMWTARAFFESLARQGPRADGHGAGLVFVGSTAALFGEREHADYGAAKAGLVGLALSLKNEIVSLDPMGRVNVVHPGWTVTHMVREELARPGVIGEIVRTMPLAQLGRAVDVARAVAFLLSPASRHVSGQELTLAGGMEGRVQRDAAEVDEDAVRARLAIDP